MTEMTIDPPASPPIAGTGYRRAARRSLWAGVLLLVLTLLLYALTLDNGLQPEELVGGDLITHQYAQVQARPSNAPGYPLYTMGGWLWFHALRPLVGLTTTAPPNPLPILSSYSTLWALLALGLLYAILNHITRSPRHPAGNWPLAFVLSAFYAVTYFFWYYATTTEQYTSAIAQTLAIVYVYFLWRDQVRGARGEGRHRSTELSTVNCQRSIANEARGEGRGARGEPDPSAISNQQSAIDNGQRSIANEARGEGRGARGEPDPSAISNQQSAIDDGQRSIVNEARGEGQDSNTELSMANGQRSIVNEARGEPDPSAISNQQSAIDDGQRSLANDPTSAARASQSLTISNQQLTINNYLLSAPTLLILLAFLCGLSLAHMLTVAFIVPPLVIAIVWEEPRVLRNGRLLLAVIVAALLPLLSYAYVYARGAVHPEWWGAGEWSSAGEWFWAFVSTAQGRDELARGFQATCAFFDGGFPDLIWGELSLPFLVVGLLGIARLGRKPAFVLYATLLIYLVFDWMYRCGNWYQVILPAYPLILLGVAAAADWWEARFLPRRWLAYAPLALLVVAIVWRFDASWPRANSHNRPEDTGLDRAAILLDQPLPQGAGLFAPVADALALDYLVNIWGIRPDLHVVSSSTAGPLLDAGGTVLATLDAAPILLEELVTDSPPIRSPFGADWLALAAQPLAPPAAPSVAIDAALGDGVTLSAYSVQPAPTGSPVTHAAPALDVTLFWQIGGAWPAGYGISLRPIAGGAMIPDATTGGVIQRDAAAPVQALVAPDSASPLADTYRIPMPESADGVMLIVYRATDGGFENLLELPLTVPPLP
ncbi:MAG: DUF2723 domain-containing protein [Caldilineaceae bacterium]|nr:DUF2723 domain-containing protein [Caldilineaceae bacterium]